jgi:hypothetical protein
VERGEISVEKPTNVEREVRRTLLNTITFMRILPQGIEVKRVQGLVEAFATVCLQESKRKLGNIMSTTGDEHDPWSGTKSFRSTHHERENEEPQEFVRETVDLETM